MHYPELINRLARRGLFRIKPGLERVQAVLKILGNPQDSVKTIHIAGTNGKGSAAACFESVLRRAGMKTGLYTSPHLWDLRERIQIDRQPVGVSAFWNAAQKILGAEQQAGCSLTYFEFLTAIAFGVFAEESVDVAVIETGMGGRWDATNVLSHPALTVITSIGLDHVQWLGKTDAAIAREKAGIAKKGVPLISGARGRAAQVIADAAKAAGAPLQQIDKDFNAENVSVDWKQGRQTLRFNGRSQDTYPTGLLGTYQTDNAAVVLAGLEILAQQGWAIGKSAIRVGLETVEWPGRFEIRRGIASAPVLFDGAHNSPAMRRLIETLDESPWSDAAKTFVFGVYQDKDYAAMLKLIQTRAERIIVCTLPGSRALPARKLTSQKTRGVIQPVSDPHKAFQTAAQATARDGLIVVCGSLALVGLLLQDSTTKELCLN